MSHADMERQQDPDLRPADVEEPDWDAADVVPAPETTEEEVRYEQELDDAEASIGLGDSADPEAPRTEQPESD